LFATISFFHRIEGIGTIAYLSGEAAEPIIYRNFFVLQQRHMSFCMSDFRL